MASENLMPPESGRDVKRRRGFKASLLRSWGQLKFALLLLPALFWIAIFLALAGVRPLEGLLGLVPELLQTAIALVCPLLGAVLGARVGVEARRDRSEEGSAWCWAVAAAGAGLFIFASVVSLSDL